MAGLGMFVKLDKQEFVGKEALAKQKAEGPAKKLVGIELEDKAIPRHGYTVLKNGTPIGEVTTGYHGISVDKSGSCRWFVGNKRVRKRSRCFLLRRVG